MRGRKSWTKLLVCLGILFFINQRALKAQTYTAQQYYQAGTQQYNAKNYSQAAQYYGAAIKLNPNYAEAYQGIGSCYYMLGNKQYALSYFQKALQLNPNNAQLSQLVQSLGGQAPAGGTAAAPVAATDPLAQGTALYQQKQYAAAISYFQQSIQQNPSNYQPYYYAALSYYGIGDAKDAALYFAMAYQKQPTNAGIKAYADRIKMGLPPADQQWVDDQVSRMSGGTGVAGGGGSSKPSFGIRLLTGMHYVLSDPTQIVQAAQAANAATSPNITSVAFSGTTPNFSFSGGLELFYQISPNFELNLGGAMTPLSSLQYTSSYSGFLTPSNFPLAGGSAPTYSNPPNYSSQAAFQYTYGASVLTASLGGKLFFGDPKTVKFSVGLGIDLSPVSLSFTKNQVDPTSNDATMNSSNPSYLDYNSSGSYGTMAFGGHLIAGMDFALGNNLSLGLYAGFRLLSASNFQNGSDTLQVNNDTSDVGPASQFTASNVAHTAPLSLDFSGAIEGLDLSIAF